MTKVLIVDDEADIVVVLAMLFRIEGFSVQTAADGESAWTLLQKDSFDAVITDIMMPRLSGSDLCERIRSSPRLQNLPIIVQSGNVRPPAGLGTLFDAYFTKPVPFDELLDAVRDLVHTQAHR